MDEIIKKYIVSGITGILLTLLITIILKLIIGDAALTMVPLFAGIITVYFSKELLFLRGMILGFIVGILTLIWAPFYSIIFAIIGGFIGALINVYIYNSPKFSTSTGSDGTNYRIKVIPRILEYKIPDKKVRYVLVIVFSIFLVWAISYSAVTEKEVEKNETTNNNSPAKKNETAELKSIEEQIRGPLQVFYGNLNVLFGSNGVNTGYIINSMNITEIQKLSKKKARVTLNITRVTNDGANFTSVWEGPFYYENKTWIDKGDFVQIHCYNATGSDILQSTSKL